MDPIALGLDRFEGNWVHTILYKGDNYYDQLRDQFPTEKGFTLKNRKISSKACYQRTLHSFVYRESIENYVFVFNGSGA